MTDIDVLCVYGKCCAINIDTPQQTQNNKNVLCQCLCIFRKLGSKQQRIEGWRQKFLSGVQSAGLEMEDVMHLSTYDQWLQWLHLQFKF